jgi:hypothetical protein
MTAPWTPCSAGTTCWTTWGEPERGGHFAAFGQPALFVDGLRSFLRLVR